MKNQQTVYTDPAPMRLLTMDELDQVSGGDAMDTATSWAGTTMGAMTGAFYGGLRGLAYGGLAGFAIGAALGGVYSLASGGGSGGLYQWQTREAHRAGSHESNGLPALPYFIGDDIGVMRPDIHIENHILGRKLPRWNGLSEKEKLRLLDTARYRTSTRRGNGRQVTILVVTVLLLSLIHI